jgi:glucose-6-phosphate isomerase
MLRANFEHLKQIDEKYSWSPNQKFNNSQLIESLGQDPQKYIYDFGAMEQIVKQISDLHKDIDFKVSYIVVLGMGGSALPAKYVVESLSNFGILGVKFIVADNIDPDYLAAINSQVQYQNTLFFVVSHSGSTIETISQACYFANQAESYGVLVRRHFVFLTSNESSPLANLAIEYSAKIILLPPGRCGRFSLFSMSTMLPASFAGVNIPELFLEARKHNLKNIMPDIDLNIALKLAHMIADYSKRGYSEIVFFSYSNRLDAFNQWTAQLFAESLGKKGLALTPVSARGVSDQHSLVQLFNEGANNKLYIFVSPRDFDYSYLKIAESFQQAPEVLKGRSFSSLLNFELQGNIDSLVKNQRPVIHLEFDSFNESSIAALSLCIMYTVVFIAKLLDVDVYTQPAVQASKDKTLELLQATHINHG